MAKKNTKNNDDVTLPGAEETPPENVDPPAEETPPENVDPPEEDTVELPDEGDATTAAEEPVSEEVPHEAPVKLATVSREKLRIIQSRNIAEIETQYAAWYSEFSGVENPGHIVERHIVEGGNGLIILCIFYTEFETAS